MKTGSHVTVHYCEIKKRLFKKLKYPRRKKDSQAKISKTQPSFFVAFQNLNGISLFNKAGRQSNSKVPKGALLKAHLN